MKKAFVNLVKTGGFYLLHICIASCVGIFLLSSVYTLSTTFMQDNVKSSAQTLQTEGDSTELSPSIYSRLDPFTDALMISKASYKDNHHPIVAAMEVNHATVKGLSPYQSLISTNLKDAIPTETSSYGRYWHGYLIFLKPLLLITDYSGIRIVNTLCQVILTGFVIYLLWRKGYKKYIIPYGLTLAILMPLALFMSLQYSACFYIFTLGCLALLLLKNRSIKNVCLVFLYLGITCAFFDLLTYPIVTFGIPAVLYFCIRKAGSLKEKLFDLLKIAASWGVGYVGMWAGKWVIGSLITRTNILKNATDQIVARSLYSSSADVANATDFDAWTTFSHNWELFFRTPISFLILVLIIVLLIIIIINIVRRQTTIKTVCQQLVPFVLIALVPFAWYIVTMEHAWWHSMFTNKSLAVTIFALLCGLFYVAQVRNAFLKQRQPGQRKKGKRQKLAASSSK